MSRDADRVQGKSDEEIVIVANLGMEEPREEDFLLKGDRSDGGEIRQKMEDLLEIEAPRHSGPELTSKI